MRNTIQICLSLIPSLFLSTAGCIQVSNVPTWTYTEGFYVQDDTLAICNGASNPRYKQIGGNGYLWSLGTWWVESSIHCDDRWSIIEFLIDSAAATPDLVPGGTWMMVNVARNDKDTHSSLVVTAVPMTQCDMGK